ncbi:EAL domain-containing protein [Luteimonas sp. SX5]|uniref:EAL domain-containing protein n=1 Tax=Luteimonas galliterrae TaxID=2940486 RepID=A0ABT0ML11_9GAMM|nr:EAL domain-containing response regulator [Luteimonas galliterrae]MCL1635581.1 EAL domain-containing protein [Luteimonas galliterrae]
MTVEAIRHPRRAETPPPQHWRRWGADAPAFEPVIADVPAVESATTQAKTAPAYPDPGLTIIPQDPAGPFRVLIAEDDPSQAKFAEGVLAGTGMQTLIVDKPADVIAAMEKFRPDLVLMDLHMPGLDGLAITNRIRAHERLMHTPVVFLTGDPDPERQYEVLAGGADDFLNKPIRPRHLVAAVLSRVQRARRLAQNRAAPTQAPSANPLTGLLERSDLIALIGNALSAEPRQGTLVFAEIAGAERLRERLGYAAYEALMIDAGRHVQSLAEECSVARLNDHAFVILASALSGSDVAAFARGLRDGLAQRAFGDGIEAVRLRASLGVVVLDASFGDAGAALDAAERALRAARVAPTGIADYVAPQPEAPAQAQSAADQVRDALAENRFELAYQPIVAVAGGDEPQYQTLLRLRDAEGHLHAAAQFLPALESNSLLSEIDHWVLERVLDTLQRRYHEQRPLRLFVPQSPRSLSRDDYADWLLGALEVHGLPGHALVVDLRLADALIHTVTLQQFCQRMMRAGVQFCLSHYEQGRDAEALLAQLPLGYLRLSPRYANAQASSTLRDEMRGVIDRAHRQGLLVIGHQIEDPQAAANLWMSGIDFIQGNLVQRASGDLEFDFHSAVL